MTTNPLSQVPRELAERLIAETDNFCDCSHDAAIAQAEAVIREAMQKAQPQWISVEEKLPEPGDYVLVAGTTHDFSTNGELWYRMAAKYVGNREFKDALGNYLSNSYWMPLPEPPNKAAASSLTEQETTK